jgi:preprotein translocase subunit SecA
MFWRKKPKIRLEGRFWMTDAACAAGFLDETLALLAEGVKVLVVTHFADTHKRVSSLLLQRNVTVDLVSQAENLTPTALMDACTQNKVPMIPFPVIQMAAPFTLPETREKVRCAVVVPEIYPTRQRDALVEEFAASLPLDVTIRFYVSLESPLMRRFAGERVSSLMEQLGVAEDQVLEHAMLTKSLQSAQERLSRLVREDRWAPSMEEWFVQNETELGRDH